MVFKKRCGTCELLVRSNTSELASWGKCPHRDGWVRTHHDACEHHLGERKRGLVRAIMALHVVLACAGFGLVVYHDVRHGTLSTHLLVVSVVAAVIAFGLFVWRFDLLSEEPKYRLLDQNDPPPEEEHKWWLDDR